MRYLRATSVVFILLLGLAALGCGNGEEASPTATNNKPPDNPNPPAVTGTFHRDAAGVMWFEFVTASEIVNVLGIHVRIWEGGTAGWWPPDTDLHTFPTPLEPGEILTVTLDVHPEFVPYSWTCVLTVGRPGQGLRFDIEI